MALYEIQLAIKELENSEFEINNSITKVLRIAQKRLDIDEILFLRFIKVHLIKENNKAVFKEVKTLAIKKGLSEEQYKELYQKVYLNVVEIRKFEKWYDVEAKKLMNDIVTPCSVSEIILDLKHYQDLLENNKVPEGLASIDAYNENKSKRKIDDVIFNHIYNYKIFLNKIKDYLMDYLIKIENELLEVREIEVLDVKKQLELLIQEGHEAKEKCFDPDNENRGAYANITGTEYVAWLEKSKMFIKKNVSDPEIYERFSEKANSANGNGTEDFDVLIGMLIALLSYDFTVQVSQQNQEIDKIFISHSSKDIEYVEALVDLLNDIGIRKSDKHIFCSSLTGYDIPYGENIYDFLKQELNNNSTMVLFILSHNYYESAPCLNEMGAAWITSKEYNSILTPNFDFKKISGAIDPTKISFHLNNEDGLNKFRDKVVEIFKLDYVDYKIWERDRNDFITKVNELAGIEASTLNAKINIEKIRKVNENDIELQLRFINRTDIDMEFKYIDFNLVDSNGNKVTLSAEDEHLEGFILFSKENKVVKWNFKNDTDYNPRRDDRNLSKVLFEIY